MADPPRDAAPQEVERAEGSVTSQSGLCEQLLVKVLSDFNSHNGDSPCAGQAEEDLRSPLLRVSEEARSQIALREAFSAVTMLAPTVGTSLVLREMHNAGTCTCLMCGLVMLAGFVAHMVASMSYHFACALQAYRPGIDVRPWRCLDQSLVFACCVTCAWSLSHSAAYAFGVVLPFIMYAVARLWIPSETEMRHHRFQRMGIGIVLYLAPIAARGEYWTLCGCLLCAVFFTVFFVTDQQLAGWGHGLMHIVLLPYGCLLMASALQVQK
uniref:Alkaline ceramidase n=1 Tax=Alexandrium andersonii TaxID=327968 RepID=A0A7S2C440_9DINO